MLLSGQVAGCYRRGHPLRAEADTLANTFKREWGQYDDKLRKAHGNEPVADLRLGGEREARKPRRSVVLSGTPDQLPAVVPSVENGLWSRFIYYGYAPDNPSEWRDVFPSLDSISPSYSVARKPT